MRRVLIALLALVALTCASAARAETIVSLGDSYSSGEAAAPYDDDTDGRGSNGARADHKCHRSPDAWPRLLGVAREHHLACSGAKTENLYDHGQTQVPPDNVGQIARLDRIADSTRIDTIVLTMGGNDMGFGPRIAKCFLWGSPGCLTDEDALARGLGRLRSRLAQAYRDVAEAGRARVLVVGYPDIVPPSGVRPHRCSWLNDTMQQRIGRFETRLDATLALAASDAGVGYVSMRDVLRGHELCTKDSWMRAIVSRPGDLLRDQQQAHPLREGQIAMAVRVRRWLSASRPPCSPAASLAAIVDDSGSMVDNDPEAIRRRALELLLTKPSGQDRTLGAVEFGSDAAVLFPPGLVSANQAGMGAALGALRADGVGGGITTNYNAAFATSGASQPDAAARLFLTDGAHNEGAYEDLHRGGPPTYVIGLNVGPAGRGDDDADLLGRIAAETGGAYFPLRLDPADTAAVQVGRLQGVVNEVDARVSCAPSDATTPTRLSTPNRRSPAIGTVLGRRPAVEVVISWGTEDVDVDLATALVRNLQGTIIADLHGRKRIGHSRRHRVRLAPSVVEGSTFDVVTIPRPRGGRTLSLTVKAPVLPVPTPVTVQVRPVDGMPAPAAGPVVPPPPPAAPPSPAPVAPAPAPPSPPPAPAPPPPPKPTATNLVVVVYGGGHVGVAFDVGWQAGRDPVTCHFFRDGVEVFTAQCGTHSSKQLYGVPPGQHSFYATVSDRFGVYSDPTNVVVRTTS